MMNTVAGTVLRRRLYWLVLAAWVAGFVVLCVVVHLREPDSVETHRYKHTFDDDELYLMSLQATQDLTGAIGHDGGTGYPPKPGHNSSKSQVTQQTLNRLVISPTALHQNLQVEIQQNRTKVTRDVCLKQRHELSSNHSTAQKPRPETSANHISALTLRTLRHIYVSDKRRFMYCCIAEAGCSNWKRALMYLENNQLNTDDIPSREAHSGNGLKTLRTYAPEERRWRLKNYKKFLFVRNPISRIVSAYRNTFGTRKVYRRAPLLYGAGRYGQHIQTGENVTWAEWIDYLTNREEEANFGDDWMQMNKLCSPCDVNYDYIGKLETFSEDADYVINALNLTDVIQKLPVPENSRPTDSSLREIKSYFEGVSRRKRRALWDTYKLDFRMFGYHKPDFLR